MAHLCSKQKPAGRWTDGLSGRLSDYWLSAARLLLAQNGDEPISGTIPAGAGGTITHLPGTMIEWFRHTLTVCSSTPISLGYGNASNRH